MDLIPLKKHSLTRARFEQLADVPPEAEWLANITNLKTRRAYKEGVREFIAFTALQVYMGLRTLGRRSHCLAQGHGKTRAGAVHRSTQALGTVFALRTGSLNFNSGTLEGLASSAKAIILNAGGGTFLIGAGATSTLNGPISGVGSVVGTISTLVI